MYHYVVTFNATIDGLKTIYGKLGASITTEDEDLAVRQVKEEATRKCKAAYPKAKQVIVTVMNIELVANESDINTTGSFQP